MFKWIKRHIEARRARKLRAQETVKAERELFLRPMSKAHAEPVLKRCIATIKSAKIEEKYRQKFLDMANSYHAFYANERGDLLGVRKEGKNIITVFADVIKPGKLPEYCGGATIEVEKGGIEVVEGEDFQLRIDHTAQGRGFVKIDSVTKVGKDAGGIAAWGIFRIALNEALKLRKMGQPVMLTAITNKLVEFYKQYGFKFIGSEGVLSAESIERGYV